MCSNKNRFSLDFSTVTGVVLCLGIFGLKFFFAPVPQGNRQTNHASEPAAVSQITEDYMKRLNEQNNANVSNSSPLGFGPYGTHNVKPTDPKLMRDR